MKTIRAVAAASLFIASMGVAAPAVAAPPANDTYSGREVLTEPLPITVTADTSEATTDADDAELNTDLRSAGNRRQRVVRVHAHDGR